MTTSINTILKNRKNKKNKKGFSLVELIVVLVIMAILAAALVPTLIGYINQTRQSNAKNECASAVSAAQTVVSSAYADSASKYYDQSNGGAAVVINTNGSLTADAVAVVTKLSEVPGSIGSITTTNGVVTALAYTDTRGVTVTYAATANANGIYSGTYSIS